MNKLLSGSESEILWVQNHPEYYRDWEHQDQVIRNIKLRYRLNEMLNKLNKVLH